MGAIIVKKQIQTSANNSTSIQAGGNVTITGISYNDVIKICYDLFKANFPKLVQKAVDEARRNVEEFTVVLERRLREKLNFEQLNKFSDPDIQYMLNHNIQASARKGKRIDNIMLADLLIERIRNSDDDFVSTTTSEAAEIIPKLTSDQISIVTISHYFHKMGLTSAKDINDIETMSTIINALFKGDLALSESMRLHLCYCGLCNMNTILSQNPLQLLQKRYPFLKSINTGELDKTIRATAPATSILLDVYNKNNLGQLTFTSVAAIIALINIQRAIPDLDIKKWLLQ